MSSAKKRKLSLKKVSPAKSKPTNTIYSMFKKQVEIQSQEQNANNSPKESGSEGDVIITKVVKSSSGSILDTPGTSSSVADAAVDDIDKSKQKNKTKALSLSSRKSQFSTKKKLIEAEAKQEKLCSSQDDFKFSGKSHSYIKQSSYKLRKRRTVPIVDSDSNDADNVNIIDDDVVVLDVHSAGDSWDVGTSGRKIRHPKKRLSLRKIQTEGDHPRTKISKDKASESKEVSAQSAQGCDSITDSDVEICDTQETDSSCISKGKKKLKLCRTQNSKVNIIESPQKSVHPISGSQKVGDKSSLSNVVVEDSGDFECSADKYVDSKEEDLSEKAKDGNSRIERNTKNCFSIFKQVKNKTVCSSGKDIPNEESSVSKNTEQENVDNVDEEEEADENKADGPYRIPYYLENFKTILDTVLSDKENARLFDKNDMKYINTFRELNECCQKLYIRIFSRKLSWLPMTRLSYPEISDNIQGLVDDLTSAGLLMSGEKLADLSEVLTLLPVADLKSLAKTFHLTSAGQGKGQLVGALVKKGQQTSISSMFTGGQAGNMEATILQKARSLLGQVCRLAAEPRAVFLRVLMLFSLYNTNLDEEAGSTGQSQLFQMLMVNIGKLVYPKYTVNRQRRVFSDRHALVRFESALQYELEIQAATDKGQWANAHDLYLQARDIGKPILRDKHFLKWDKSLPEYLRLYTAGSVYTRVNNQGVEILQRLRLYKKAVDLLQSLLAQNVYCPHYRGHWYERLALNLDAHLKSPQKSLEVVQQGLSDPMVRVGRRLALYERAKKICEAPKSRFSDWMKDIEHEPVLPTPETVIEGTVISDATSVGMKYQFVMPGDGESVTLCAVEELVLDHYKHAGYPEGLHAEGSIISNLFVLFCYDIMFEDVADVFYGPFQTCPLDLTTRDFYHNRKELLDDRLEWLRVSDTDVLCEEIGRVWAAHSDTMCTGISWDKFTGPTTHQGLVRCMGGAVVAGILDRYVKDPRHTRSGFPDLTLWNTDTCKLKICEVKGPTDRLSYKQILWIDYLLKLGVDAEVCYVKAIGAKKLKPKA